MISAKKIVFCLLLASAVAAVGLGMWKASEDSFSTGKLIRFHVIANSDSLSDQALKLKVRDRVVNTMSPVLAGAGDVEAAGKRVDENLGLIASAATAALNENGCDTPVRVMHGRFDFPEKKYSIKVNDKGETQELTLPAGEYDAVRVVIGEGKGANWWCVLFPPLCFVEPSEGQGGGITPGITADDIPAFKYNDIKPGVVLADPPVEYRFKLVDWYKKIREVI